MAKKTAANTVARRKVICRASTTNVPIKSAAWDALMRLSTPELKNLLRAAKIGIPKEKHMMAERLSEHQAVAVSVTTEAVVFGEPKLVRLS